MSDQNGQTKITNVNNYLIRAGVLTPKRFMAVRKNIIKVIQMGSFVKFWLQSDETLLLIRSKFNN